MSVEVPLPLLGTMQLSNSALAIAACKSSNSWVGIYRQKRLLPVWQNQLAWDPVDNLAKSAVID